MVLVGLGVRENSRRNNIEISLFFFFLQMLIVYKTTLLKLEGLTRCGVLMKKIRFISHVSERHHSFVPHSIFMYLRILLSFLLLSFLCFSMLSMF